jgi:Flp pilus assembly protein TadG
MHKLRAFPQDACATAAIEFAGAAMFLVMGLLNATDLGYYMYQRMEVENAAHAGAQAAWKTCYDQSSMLPATENCPGLNGAITTAIQSTSLGNAVALASGYPTEGYYCVNSSNVLQSVGSLSAKPSDCSAAGSSTTSPGDYVQVEVTYAYSPLFAVSVMGLSSVRSIIKTSWMLLG